MLPYVDKIEFELQPRPTKGTDGKPLLYPHHVPAMKCDLDYIDEFCANYRGTNRHKGFRKRLTQVGNAQMYDEKAMEAALRQSVSNGYITVKTFQVCSGLKYKSARHYLDSLCEGEAPRLRRSKDAGALHYFPVNMSDSDQ